MNNLGTLHLRDTTFQQDNAGDSQLLIQVSPKRLSYAVINAQKQLSILYDGLLQMSLDETFDALFAETEYLAYEFKTVKIAAESFHFTFIPQNLFAEENLSVYQSLVSKTKDHQPQVSTIRKADIKNIFTVSEDLIRPFLERFPDAIIHSQAEAFIDGILSNYQGDKKLFLQFNPSSFEIAVLSNSSLLFYNIFPFETVDDFNYYLLLVLQQLNLTETNLEVILSGDIDSAHALYQRIEKYFNKISFASNVRLAKPTYVFNEVPEHRFFSLQSLYLCE